VIANGSGPLCGGRIAGPQFVAADSPDTILDVESATAFFWRGDSDDCLRFSRPGTGPFPPCGWAYRPMTCGGSAAPLKSINVDLYDRATPRGSGSLSPAIGPARAVDGASAVHHERRSDQQTGTTD
jgi:hypothetical protein